ncbi:hypothetical protein niasHT_010330 [Heterodera trifolii]|uniref:Peptidase C1A papain C-terminal domain-containing protein n=1 Tax=Heterodera trifolii TaxID=157864 RepID=A0ABD2M8S5_9BILA
MEKAKKEMDEVNKKQGMTWKAQLMEHFSMLDDSELRFFVRTDERAAEESDDGKLPEVPHQFGGLDGYEIRPKPLVAEETELEHFGQVDPSTYKAISESEAKHDSVTCNDYRFDIRKKWPECAKIISKIRDQSRCLSCYAVAGASAFSDRFCVALAKRGWPVPPAEQDASYFSAADIMQCGKAGGKDA